MFILIVDDDESFGELTQRRLTLQGYQVEYFKGPFGTTNLVKTRAPDVLVMDVHMPGLTGDALVGILARETGARRPLVLLTSGMDAKELGALAARIGADDWVSKSAPRDELITKVRALAARRAERAS